jgi:hypothetical protein
MRKLTVLLLAGAFLVITGGTSVAGDKDFAILVCGSGAVGVPDVVSLDATFDIPDECVFGASCSGCAKAVTKVGKLKLVDTLVAGNIWMIFSTKKTVFRDD